MALTSLKRSVCRVAIEDSRSLITARIGAQLRASPHSAVRSRKCSSGESLHRHALALKLHLDRLKSRRLLGHERTRLCTAIRASS